MEEIRFSTGNYLVCWYCTNIMMGVHIDGSKDGCKLIKNYEGKYARMVLFKDDLERLKEHRRDAVLGLKGCDNFKSNGLPAHPNVLETLISENQLCSSIPSDANATETSWDFSKKVEGFLPQENIVSYKSIQ
jgi:hypothetical protein